VDSVSKAPISNAAKVMLVVFVIVGTIRMIDFIFYGQEIRSALSAIGFSLMAYGLYRNGFEKRARHASGLYATYLGAALVLASIAVRFLA
jgi:hypothetical protein